MRWLIPLVVLLFLGGFGAALVATGAIGGSDDKSATTASASGAPSETAQSPTDLQPSPTSATTEGPPAVTETVTETAPATPTPVTLPREAEVCLPVREQYGPVAYAARGNDMTSCPFTLNVQEAYVAAGGADATVIAYSPAMKRTYSMECTGSQPVTCRGGNNAVVLLFEGEPRR
ncbi:MAG: hypothetical protein V9G19_01650 [Tetrasphaera sp.]